MQFRNPNRILFFFYSNPTEIDPLLHTLISSMSEQLDARNRLQLAGVLLAKVRVLNKTPGESSWASHLYSSNPFKKAHQSRQTQGGILQELQTLSNTCKSLGKDSVMKLF